MYARSLALLGEGRRLCCIRLSHDDSWRYAAERSALSDSYDLFFPFYNTLGAIFFSQFPSINFSGSSCLRYSRIKAKVLASYLMPILELSWCVCVCVCVCCVCVCVCVCVWVVFSLVSKCPARAALLFTSINQQALGEPLLVIFCLGSDTWLVDGWVWGLNLGSKSWCLNPRVLGFKP